VGRNDRVVEAKPVGEGNGFIACIEA